ncbi:hypothetical protein BV25DRAFT_1888613 [Artomyces pyxidatus]|uniref:Uncharacterized protein n=1 Tax=Artomyces pyxidatus TaxID=48021 RepID=A0ACB8SV43_9AGAM|nr:hypothetical protein BV25DRAFT_1888613 [Artomyces pyxidatus]
MFVILLLIWAHAAFASSVSVRRPLDDQYPLIARINSSYSWAFAEDTFASLTNASLTYTASQLPAWLSFDPSTRTLHGTPSPPDEGTPRIRITANDTATFDTASSWVSLCVTPYPPPAIQNAIAAQFNADNPSLSSVFVLSPNSALSTDAPTLRIPPGWSFSIGFDWKTFNGSDTIYYSALQADGSPLPPWMTFDSDGITLDGVTPHQNILPTPHMLSLALHASDQEGYSASSVPFAVVIAPHELSAAAGSLPTINITASTSLDVALNSPIDFAGILVDTSPIDPADVVSLSIDTSQSPWLHYDEGSKRLSGQPPKDLDRQNGAALPVTLMTSFNQTLHTNVHVAVVPSFFSQSALDPILVDPGKNVDFSLARFFSNATGMNGRSDDVNLTASYDPREASDYLRFDSSSALLSGTVPQNVSSTGANYSHITVTFTAYSRITHSTSHTTLPVSLTPADYNHSQPANQPHSGRLSPAARRKLLLGLGIAFGIIGGFLMLGLLLACFRRCARVNDSALTGDAGARAWTEKERQWYGIGNVGRADPEKGYGWTDNSGPSMTAAGARYGDMGLGLQRVLTRTASNSDSAAGPRSPGQLSKAEFVGKLRATVRNVSNRYRRARKSAIGKPMMLLGEDQLAGAGAPATPALAALRGFDAADFSGAPSSLRSPSSSTAERSIPKRRADFAPPKSPKGPRNPAAAHVRGDRTSTHDPRPSVDSAMSVVSLASNSSTRTHATEAVVHKAARATSVRSMKSASGQSYHSQAEDAPRTRLVPFTDVNRVPVPQLPPKDGADAGTTASGRSTKKRVVSQAASVVRNSADGRADELAVGMRYVRALGEDKDSARSPSGSFSSLESSHKARSSLGSGSGIRKSDDVLRILVRAAERFRFRLHVRPLGGDPQAAGQFTARQLSGKALPPFLYADLDMARGGPEVKRHKDTVKFWGIPRVEDVGEVHVGVYAADGECVGQAVVEVIGRG